MGMFRVLWSRVGSALSRAAVSLSARHFGHVRLGHAGRSCSPSFWAGVAGRGISAFAALVLSFIMLLSGVLVFSPVERASADTVELGPDGYFSTLNAGDKPVASAGWASTRRIVFGKQGSSGTYNGGTVSGGYKTLAKGAVASVPDADFGVNQAYSKSATTSVAAGEALLWADNVVTAGFRFDTNGTYRNSFDSATGSYRSNLALVSDAVGAANYSSFEQSLLRSAPVEGVCTAAQSAGCSSGSYTAQSNSVNSYKVFPLSIGDVRQYFNHTSGWSRDSNLVCPSSACANGVSGFWLRSAYWSYAQRALVGWFDGLPAYYVTDDTGFGLRQAFRLNLDNLLLSADSSNQSQSASGDLRLTFVDPGKRLSAWSASVTGGAGSRALNLSGSSDLGSELGWKIVDPAQPGKVLGSGRTSSGGNALLPESQMTDENKDYDLYVWGQQDGSATAGLTNRATEPVKTTIRGGNVTGQAPPFGIELTGTTAGTLRAYRIGEYDETAFTQTGALRSVKLSTPADPVRSSVLAAAGVAGGVHVDGDNPAGWVAAHWLGYPTDPLSDDSTSAFSPFAGRLQLFARALRDRVLADGDASLGGVQGSLSGLSGGPETLVVSGPGLYLVVDDSGASLPIIVGTKVFNEDVGEEGEFVDFVDAGVRGKPRLGVASLKTSVMDVSKRVVNDAGMDGFDVGASVEFEVALQVPDLSGFSSLSYASYEFGVVDMAAAGLVLPDPSEVRVFMDVPAPDTEVTGSLPPSSIGVTGQALTVAGLKALFAEDVSGHVANRADVPAGSLVRIRYAAVVDADTGAKTLLSAAGAGEIQANENMVTLTRSKSDGSTEQKSATANVYSFQVNVMKVDKDTPATRLAGAVFEVSRDGETLEFVDVGDGVYRLAVGGDAVTTQSVVSHTDGSLVLQGVEARELSFRETEAPSGYFKVSGFTVDVLPEWNPDASEVTLASYRTEGTNLAYVSEDGRRVVVGDPIWSLANLPYTGGIGILLLFVAGGTLFILAIRPYYLSHNAEATANLLE
ncbi:MAG: SpaA isopeptide-forming pilin-related protein [Bifidobacterium sp.]|uniref:SpaA isopeptide-forming pilin-related protein n=1 Tax=Bifidobacterium sp. TaxID=41200 RepID=UPI0039ED0BDB